MIKSRITLKQLEAFVFVVDTGTFRAAATMLGTTQPNISARIAALESALDVPLLLRSAGSIRLTEKGAALLARARDVVWAGEALLEEADRRDLIEERLRLGVTELVACTWLQDFLRLLKEAYPRVRVELQVDLSTVIDTRLMAGELDLTLQSGPFATRLDGTLLLGSEPYCWVAEPKQAAAIGCAPAMADIFAHPVLTHAQHTQAGHALHHMAETRGLDIGQIVHSSALSACVPMVCEGLGIALLPERLVQDELRSGVLHGLNSDWLPEPLTFYARYHAARAPRFVRQAAEFAQGAMEGRSPEHHKNLSPQQN